MAKKNIYPVDWQYQLPEQVLSALDEYHILKVPLLGQHYEKGPWDWCGRTSCSMAYNYYQVIQGGDFKSRFITHWDGGKPGQFVDLRYPGGQRAFHTKPTQPPHNINLDKYAISSRNYDDVAVVGPPREFSQGDSNGKELKDPDYSASRVLGFSRGQVLPYDMENRKAKAAQIANDPGLIERQLSTILKALISNNPVIFYSGFSATKDAPIHLILIIGYAYLVDSSGRNLWLVVADPSTQGNKVGKKGASIFFPPNHAKTNEHDLDALYAKQITGDHDLIRVFPGEWDNAKASLVMIRARKLFEDNTYSTVRDDLYMDYCNPENKGGTFIYSHRQTPVPSDFVYTNVVRSVAYPCDGLKDRFRPANCYEATEQAAAGLFPLGRVRNLHSGIHLGVSQFSVRALPKSEEQKAAEQVAAKGSEKKGQAAGNGQTAAKGSESKSSATTSAPPTGEREVRCIAPGYVVAVRLTNALPEPIREVQKQDANQETAAQGATALGEAKKGEAKQEEAKQKEPTPDELAREFTGNHNSFVLVRHDVEEVVQKDEQADAAKEKKPKRFTFYSLYMHLVPPKWDKDPNTYRNVGWLKTFARRHGSLVVLDSENSFFRKTRWLQEPPKAEAKSTGTVESASTNTSASAPAVANTPAPSEDSEIVPKTGGTFSIIGDGLGAPVAFNLGDEKGEDLRAVWKKPHRDVSSLHDALRDGKVVTLRHPYLKMEAGELVGYIHDKSEALSEGFLHWEILGPSGQGQLKDFLEFAEQKLGLGGFFKRFKEEQQNNFFDPPIGKDGKGELDSLLDLAAVSKRAGTAESDQVKRFRGSYDHEALKQSLQSPRALAFSSDDTKDSEAATGSAEFKPEYEPSYPAEIVISNYKNALPAGSYALKITFEPEQKPPLPPLTIQYDGKQTRIPIRLPARARRIFVEPADANKLLLQTGGGSTDALQKDVQHFKQLASVRWRNVVLEHLNEWMPDSIVTQVMEHLKIHQELCFGEHILEASKQDDAKTILGKYAKAVGWWAHEEEVPFLGPQAGKDDQKKLFADQPDADQLPKTGLIDNPHPVTFTWLLMLLNRHNLIRFVDTPLWQSEEMKKIIAVGWLPARSANPPPRRVGDLVHIAAVVRGSGEEPVTVHAKFTGTEVQGGGDAPVATQAKREAMRLQIASGKCSDGAFIEPAEVPGWGEWTLDEPGALGLGGLKLTGLRPELLGGSEQEGGTGAQFVETLFAPASHKDGTFSWRISFQKNCPKLLRGWVFMRIAKQPVKKDKKDKNAPAPKLEFTLADLAIPVQGREDTALKENEGFVVVDGFVQKGNIKDVSTYITQHFTYKEYLDAASKSQVKGSTDGGPKIAWELVEAVERIRSGYATRQSVNLLGLSEDGLSIQLRASNVEALRSVVAQTKADGWIEDAEEAGKGDIRIRVSMPEKSLRSGDIVIDFDANDAFTELRKGLPESEEVHVQFGCFFPNGGGALDPRLLPKDTLGTRCEQVKLDELKLEAGFGYLELWSTVVADVFHSSPMFEAPTVTITDKGVRFSARLLGGNAAFWKAAEPVIKVGHPDLDEAAKKQSNIVKDCVVRTFSFNDLKNFQGEAAKVFSLSAEVLNKRVPLGTERIDVQPVKGPAYNTQRDATIKTSRRVDNPFILTVSLVTSAVPVGRGFTLVLSSTKKGSAALTLKKNTIRYKPDRGGFGTTGVDGSLNVEVDVSDVAAALAGETEFQLRFVPRDGKVDGDLKREVKRSIFEEYEQRAPDVKEIRDMWEGVDASVPMEGELV